MMVRMVNGKGMALDMDQDTDQDLDQDLDPGWKIWILRLDIMENRYHGKYGSFG